MLGSWPSVSRNKSRASGEGWPGWAGREREREEGKGGGRRNEVREGGKRRRRRRREKGEGGRKGG